MNLIETLQALKAGKKVRRKMWSKEQYIYLAKDKVLVNQNNIEFELYCSEPLKNAWELYEEEKPILDIEEKTYLEAVLRPFKDRVESVYKKAINSSVEGNIEFLTFDAKSAWQGHKDYFSFPTFKAGTMYKGMELDKEYTLKELGLFDRKIY